jgi:hypothetical protein
MSLRPEVLRDRQGIEIVFCPPIPFVAEAVDLAMVCSAQRDSEVITHLAAERPRLGEGQVVRIGGLPATKDASVRGNEFQMRLVAVASRFADRKYTLVDALTLTPDGVWRFEVWRLSGSLFRNSASPEKNESKVRRYRKRAQNIKLMSRKNYFIQ